ncbi:hypothetical protein CDAR_256731 [Caerostris darwini]|uniref:Uncharacterized protein n=1 Tax=Caerostris darwini TaxID=1538125 RepID=A0AAV4PZW8_9ARAC|nr:hypothetical protein CDAR_256731 [Caerostris darwini]
MPQNNICQRKNKLSHSQNKRKGKNVTQVSDQIYVIYGEDAAAERTVRKWSRTTELRNCYDLTITTLHLAHHLLQPQFLPTSPFAKREKRGGREGTKKRSLIHIVHSHITCMVIREREGASMGFIYTVERGAENTNIPAEDDRSRQRPNRVRLRLPLGADATGCGGRFRPNILAATPPEEQWRKSGNFNSRGKIFFYRDTMGS